MQVDIPDHLKPNFSLSGHQVDYILAILSFIEIKLKFGTWRQNRDFFGTFFALWSHLGPSPEFGTLSERLIEPGLDLNQARCALIISIPGQVLWLWRGAYLPP